MRRCPNCNAELTDEVTECPRCGHGALLATADQVQTGIATLIVEIQEFLALERQTIRLGDSQQNDKLRQIAAHTRELGEVLKVTIHCPLCTRNVSITDMFQCGHCYRIVGKDHRDSQFISFCQECGEKEREFVERLKVGDPSLAPGPNHTLVDTSEQQVVPRLKDTTFYVGPEDAVNQADPVDPAKRWPVYLAVGAAVAIGLLVGMYGIIHNVWSAIVGGLGLILVVLWEVIPRLPRLHGS